MITLSQIHSSSPNLMLRVDHRPSGPHDKLSAADTVGFGSYIMEPGDGPLYGYASRLDPVVVNDLCDAFCDGTGISTGGFVQREVFGSAEKAKATFAAESGRAVTFASRAIQWAVADAKLADIDPSYDFDTHATYDGDILSDWKAMTTLMGHPSELIDAEREMTEVELQTANATLRKLTDGPRYMKREEEEGTTGPLTQPSLYDGLRSPARRREAILATCKGYHTGKSQHENETFSGARSRRIEEGKIEWKRKQDLRSQRGTQFMKHFVESLAEGWGPGRQAQYGTHPSDPTMGLVECLSKACQ